MAAGLLHDVVEDTHVTLDVLKHMRLDDQILDLVDLLTRKPEDQYADYLKRIKKSHNAVIVKKADILCNLSDCLTPDQVYKYSRALKFLLF